MRVQNRKAKRKVSVSLDSKAKEKGMVDGTSRFERKYSI